MRRERVTVIKLVVINSDGATGRSFAHGCCINLQLCLRPEPKRRAHRSAIIFCRATPLFTHLIKYILFAPT